MKTKCMSCGGSMKKMQKGGSKDKWGRSSSSAWYGFDPKNKKWTGNKALSSAELKALSHQKRGMGQQYGTYVKKSGPIMNELGALTNAQQTQLKNNMRKASTLKKIYEGLPNIGRIVGSSAADIPKGSKLEKQKNGGMVKKMAVGGTTTKRIIKKSTGGMYGIPQENLGTSGQYGFAQKGGVIKAIKKVVKKITRPTLRKAQNGGMTKADPYGVSLVNKNYKTKGSNKLGGKTNMGPTKIVPKKVDPIAPKASKTRTIERNGTFEMKTGGSTKATKFAALAPPYNKATFADKIVGAKKSAKKK